MQYATGVDIIEVGRIKAAYERWPDRFLKRTYTPYEIDEFKRRNHSFQFLAGRFAAKEAVKKTFGAYGQHVAFCDIEIKASSNGAPQATVMSQPDMPSHLTVSISHTHEYAVATCIMKSALSGGEA